MRTRTPHPLYVDIFDPEDRKRLDVAARLDILGQYQWWPIGADMREGAAEIRRLQARVAELEASRGE